MNIIRKLKNLAIRIINIDKKLSEVKESLGRIEARQIKTMELENINEAEFKVYSQWGEDGIIQYLIDNLKIENKIFVEFGVQNYTESNTRFLLVNNNWCGLVIDGSKENIEYIKKDDIYWRYNLKAECEFITAENINEIITRNGIKGKIGLLSVDIDGVDYWVWKAINCIEPDIVICEYNHRFGKEEAVTVPYKSNFIRSNEHYSNIYYGASIKAFEVLAKEKGYKMVAVNNSGNNVFFVKKDLINDKIVSKNIDEIFISANFRESLDRDKRLIFMSKQEEQLLLEKIVGERGIVKIQE